MFLPRYAGEMAEEDEVRELIGRMSAAQRQGFHVTPGALKVVLAALRLYLGVRTWMATPHAPADEARKQTERYAGPPATISGLKVHGLVACTIDCDGALCSNSKRVTFDELGLPDHTTFVDIPKWRSFRCSMCGGRRVRVSPDWTDHSAQGNGRRPASR